MIAHYTNPLEGLLQLNLKTVCNFGLHISTGSASTTAGLANDYTVVTGEITGQVNAL